MNYTSFPGSTPDFSFLGSLREILLPATPPPGRAKGMWSIQAVKAARGRRSFWMAISRLTSILAGACLLNLTNHGLSQPREKVIPGSEPFSVALWLQAEPCAVPTGAAGGLKRHWQAEMLI